MSLPSSADSEQIQTRHYAGLFLLSLAHASAGAGIDAGAVGVVVVISFAFLVTSTVLLGFGASGVTLALWTSCGRIELDLGWEFVDWPSHFAWCSAFGACREYRSTLFRWRSITVSFCSCHCIFCWWRCRSFARGWRFRCC